MIPFKVAIISIINVLMQTKILIFDSVYNSRRFFWEIWVGYRHVYQEAKYASNVALTKFENGGATWSRQNVIGFDSTHGFNSIQMLNNSTGYAFGSSSKIAKTTNGGIMYVTQTNNEIPKNLS